ncbi:MAG: hypothetical protein DRQ56_04340, partial [Gammaproteobacteria bacterium]
MANKKISELTTIAAGVTGNKYIEVYDGDEALPADQNKKKLLSALKTDLGSHTQNTDFYLDLGGSDEVAADDLADAVAAMHNQGTDLGLDTGGSNPVTAA